MYKLIKPHWSDPEQNHVQRMLDMVFIPFDPSNIDYQNFKAEINADQAQLENADGNLMTAAQAKAYIKELP